MSEQMDAEEVINLLDIVWSDIDQIIIDHGGIIDKHNGDNVIALWSIEKTTAEDPFLAAQVAKLIIDFKNRIKTNHEVSFRVGIHYGSLISGRVGLNKEFTVIGDTVNLTARLESSAENNTIQISSEFAYLIKDKYDLEDLGEIAVKGKKDKIRTFKILDERNIYKSKSFIDFDYRFSDFIKSRKKEIDEGIYIIQGASGSGKSSLYKEVLSIEELNTSQKTIEIFSLESESKNSLYILRQLILKLLNIKLELGNVFKLVNKYSTTENKEIILSIIFGDDYSNDSVMLSDEVLFVAVKTLIDDYMSTIETDKLVILVEEYSYIDTTSKILLEKITQGYLRCKMLIISTSVELEYPKFIHKYKIKDLDVESSFKLLKALDLQLDEDKVLNLIEHSGGNLLFFIELSKYVSDPNNKDLPPTLYNLIQIYTDALSLKTSTTIKNGSICGNVFDEKFVSFVLKNENVLPLLEEARNHSIIHKNLDGIVWNFNNKIIRDQVYESILLEKRVEIHNLYAIWLEKNKKSASQSEIAYHYAKSRNYEKAYKIYYSLAKLESDKGMFFSSLDLISAAEKLIEHLNLSNIELFDMYYLLAQSNVKTSNLKEATIYIDKTYAQAESINDPTKYLKIIELDGLNNLDTSQIDRQVKVIGRLDAIIDTNEKTYATALFLLFRSQIDYENNDISEFNNKLRKCINISKEIGAKELQAQVQVMLAVELIYFEDFEAALKNLQESIELLDKKPGNFTIKVKAQMNMAEVYGQMGNEKLRNQTIRKSWEILKNSQRGNVLVITTLNLAESELILENFHLFSSVIKEALNLFKSPVPISLQGFCLSIYARYLFCIGEIEKAYYYIGASFNVGERIKAPMKKVADSMYEKFSNIEIPNKKALIEKGSKQDLLPLVLDLLDNFDERFKKEF